MEKELFDTSTREGKMLYLAIGNLMTHPQFKGLEAAAIARMLEEGIEQLEHFRM